MCDWSASCTYTHSVIEMTKTVVSLLACWRATCTVLPLDRGPGIVKSAFHFPYLLPLKYFSYISHRLYLF